MHIQCCFFFPFFFFASSASTTGAWGCEDGDTPGQEPPLRRQIQKIQKGRKTTQHHTLVDHPGGGVKFVLTSLFTVAGKCVVYHLGDS